MPFVRTVSIAAAAVIIAVTAMPTQADNTQGITDTVIKIGNLGPFTGKSSIFTPLNYGPEAYLRHINAQGGLHGPLDILHQLLDHPGL